MLDVQTGDVDRDVWEDNNADVTRNERMVNRKEKRSKGEK